MSGKNTLYRMVAIIGFLASGLAACAEADDPVTPTTAPDVTSSRTDPRIDALRNNGVSDYDPSQGALDWDHAEIRTVNDRFDQAILVPIVHGGHDGTWRFLAARVIPNHGGSTFETVVLELTIDEASGELTSGVTVKNADGSAKLAPEPIGLGGNCFTRCMAPVGFACVNSCAYVPQCTAACVAAAAIACGIYCLW